VGIVCGAGWAQALDGPVFERLSGEPFEKNFSSRVDYFLASPFIRPERRRRQAIPVVKIAVFGIILPGVAD
jgi:hypothetical protein